MELSAVIYNDCSYTAFSFFFSFRRLAQLRGEFFAFARSNGACNHAEFSPGLNEDAFTSSFFYLAIVSETVRTRVHPLISFLHQFRKFHANLQFNFRAIFPPLAVLVYSSSNFDSPRHFQQRLSFDIFFRVSSHFLDFSLLRDVSRST